MGEEKAISYDQGFEKVIAWSLRWAKEQESVLTLFPVTMEVKNP